MVLSTFSISKTLAVVFLMMQVATSAVIIDRVFPQDYIQKAAGLLDANKQAPLLAVDKLRSQQSDFADELTTSKPIVIWHGMGDHFDSSGIERTSNTLQKITSSPFIYAIRLSNDSNSDAEASMVGKVTEQVDQVCEQLRNVPELADGFNAIGYSQGGLFLRAYVEKCNDPPVSTLISFGSPHNGIGGLPACAEHDFFCNKRNQVFESQAYSNYAQNHIISAQYFRDPTRYDEYLENSAFLADVNNERTTFDQDGNAVHGKPEYAANVASLDRLVMVMFDKDITVVPKETSWFYEYDKVNKQSIPLQQTSYYKEDWLGLKTLDGDGKLFFETLPGGHMEIEEEGLEDLAARYLV